MIMKALGSNVINFDTLSSTNAYLRDNYQQFAHGTVARTHSQTNGKGRFNRTWFAGEDLLVSVLIKENIKLSEISRLGLVCAAAVFDVLKKYVTALFIKWPNDILVNDKKIAGILLESIIEENRLLCLIIGIGINVNTINYPPELTKKSVSLRLATGKIYAIDALYEELIEKLNDYYFDFKIDNNYYARVCAENSCLIGRDIVFNDNITVRRGRVIDIRENGNILIDENGISKEYNYGEISLSDFYYGKAED